MPLSRMAHPSFLRYGAGAFPPQNAKGYRFMAGEAALFNDLQQNLHTPHRHLLGRLADGGKLRHQVIAQRQTVHADDRHILRHPQVILPQGTDDTDGNHIRNSKNSGKFYPRNKINYDFAILQYRSEEFFIIIAKRI